MNKFKFIPFYLISFLPFPVLYFFSDLLFLIAFYIVRYRREVVAKNLKMAFPEKSDAELYKIEVDFYKHFSDLLVESLKTLSMSEKSIRKRFKVNNTEFVQQLYKEKRNAIIYSAHFGNWEWFTFLPLFLPFQIASFYQALSNQYFDDFMKLLRSNFDVICLETNTAVRGMYNLVKQPKPSFTIIIGDQSPRFNNNSTFWINFLHQETAFISGPEKIAQKFNLPMVYPIFKKPKRGHYEVEFKLLEEQPQGKEGLELLEQYAAELEKNIIESPHLWLWSHNRWKLKTTSSDR